MAAAFTAIRLLYTCMGFSAAAAQSMVDEQGLTSLEDIKALTDQRVESLCKVIRRPGGRDANVAPGDPGAANIGIQVSLKAEFNLMLAAFLLVAPSRPCLQGSKPRQCDSCVRSVPCCAPQGRPRLQGHVQGPNNGRQGLAKVLLARSRVRNPKALPRPCPRL